MDELQQRKLLSALCHGAILLSSTLVSVAIPIVILFITTDAVVKQNARESLNFHINLYLYAIVCLILMFFLIGIPLLIAVGIASWIMPIIAIVKVVGDPDTAYSYPFIVHIV
jgi:uncharacterized Tic20 family protein